MSHSQDMPDSARPSRGDAPSPRDERSVPAPLPKGLADARVGPYHLLRILGEGGFGVVYLAERREPFVQQVALKVLRPGMDSAAILQRFDLERQALALMDHPGIAKVLDGGVTDGTSRLGAGRPYFVMELVRGEPISDYCRQRSLSIDQRVELFLAVCDAVQHAHTKGVIHRDLKPSNILVSDASQGGRPMPKVIDFGIAKAVSSGAPEQAMTMTGQFLGTPEYMSPEQAAGAGTSDVDTRSDVYSLGVVLYRLLTGLLPFEPDQLWKAGLLETMRVIREVEPPKPSTRVASDALTRTGAGPTAISPAATPEPPEILSRRLRGDLDWICMRALEKSRERRYQSPGALAADLRRFLNTEPVEAGPPTTGYRIGKFVRRNRLLVGAGTTTIVAIVVGLVMALLSAAEARHQRDTARDATTSAEAAKRVAEREREAARTNLAAALRQQRAAEATMGYLDRATRFMARPSIENDLSMIDLLDQVEREVMSEKSGGDPDTRIATLAYLGELYRALGRLTKAERTLSAAREVTEQIDDKADLRRASIAQALAQVYLDQNRFSEGAKLAEEAVGIARASGAPDAPAVLSRSLSTLGAADLKLGRRDEAVRFLRESIAVAESLPGDSNDLAINPLSTLALALLERPETRREALAVAERSQAALQAAADQGRRNDMLRLATLNTIGRARRELGQLEEAERAYREALAICDEIPATPPLLTASTQINLALVLRERGDGEEARGLAARSVATRRILLPGTPDLADALDIVAGLEADRGGLAAAEEIYREEIEILTQPDIGSDLAAARARTGLAEILVRTGRYEAAVRVAETALNARTRGLSTSDWRIYSTQSVLAVAKAGVGETDEARRLILQAIDKIRADPATTPGRLATFIKRAVDVYTLAGQTDEADRWQRELNGLIAGPK